MRIDTEPEGTGNLPTGGVRHVVELVGVHKSFSKVQALRGVDLALTPGRIHALVGQNGAGKSTLIKVLTGAIKPDAGGIRIFGAPVRFRDPADAQAAGLSVVHQDGQLFNDLSVADNVFASHPATRSIGPFRVRDRGAARDRAQEVLGRLGLDLDPGATVRHLAPTDRKLVEVARALAIDATILVLDEPTATLDPVGTQRVLDTLRHLSSKGLTILFVSHKLDEVLGLSDHVTTLKDGQIIDDSQRHELDLARLVRLLAGRNLSTDTTDVPTEGVELLAAEGVSTPGLQQTTMRLRSGQVLTLTGLVGSGANALARILAGATDYTHGRVISTGQQMRGGDRTAAVKLGIGLVPEDRRGEGIVPEMSLEENIALSSIDLISRRGIVSRKSMRAQAERFIELLDIRPTTPKAAAGTLSGGNQQKVLLARCLAAGARVLITEEPTHGLDVAAKEETTRILRDFAADGGSIVVVSLDVSEYAGLPTEIGVFRAGELVAMLSGSASAEEVQSRAVGLTTDQT